MFKIFVKKNFFLVTKGFQNAKDIENPLQTTAFLKKNPVFKGFFEFFFLFFNFFPKPKKMLLPRVEAVLNPKFGVVISKTATCSLRTDRHTDKLSCPPMSAHCIFSLWFNYSIRTLRVRKVKFHYQNRFAIWKNQEKFRNTLGPSQTMILFGLSKDCNK